MWTDCCSNRGNVKQLQRKIDFLWSNQDVLQRFSERCIQKIQAYSIDRYVEQLMEIYRQCQKSSLEDLITAKNRGNMAKSG